MSHFQEELHPMTIQRTRITSKGEASRARLLQASIAEFAEKGYHSTKISEIVKRAGLTQAAFYLYFPSKDQVYNELVQDYRARLRELANSGEKITILPTEDVPGQARENLRAVFEFMMAEPELTRIAFYDAPEAEQMKREMIGMFMRNLLNNQKAGHMRSDLSMAVVAQCFLGMIERTATKFLFSGELDPEQLADQVIEVLYFGIYAGRPYANEAGGLE
jgi:TetR/AcrR family transcriptional regulator, fatty acid metabolism regulator protein